MSTKSHVTMQTKEAVKPDNSVHQGISCDNCEVTPIKGRRYTCITCFNFQFCEQCYKEKKDDHDHNVFTCITLEKAKLPTVHQGITCSGCSITPIVGNAHNCTVCQNVNFCDKCFIINEEAHSHEFAHFN